MVVIVDDAAAVAPPNGETRMFSNSTSIVYKTYTPAVVYTQCSHQGAALAAALYSFSWL